MSKTWVGKCIVCGKTSGYFQRATYEGAPDEGVTVHQNCLGKFYQQLMDEQWKQDMEQAYRTEDDRLDNEALLDCVKYLRSLDDRPSTRKWNPDPHGVSLIGEREFAWTYGSKPDTRKFPKNDGNIDAMLWLRTRKGRLVWGEIDVKTSSKPAYVMPVKPRIIQDHRIFVMSQLLDHDEYLKQYLNDEEYLKQRAKMLGWMMGRDVKAYPIEPQWFGNDADVHLVPVGELRSMDDLKAAYQGRWRWNDMADHPLKHPPEGYPARYR
jgi:hypothetical protein